MEDKVLLCFIIAEVLFIGTAGLIFGVAVTTTSNIANGPTIDTVASNLLLAQAPLDAAIANAVFIFLTFLLAIPIVAFPKNRLWVQVQAYAIVFCCLFTLFIGLDIWFSTLKIRASLLTVWGQQSSEVQSLLQQKFNCCGYLDAATPPFVKDVTCPSPLQAAQRNGCVGLFSDFADTFLDKVFVAIFIINILDFILFLCLAMLAKTRAERERFKEIDNKSVGI
ncbi:MAG: phospholipid scramblase 1 [Thelocarpon superellum]|nr:MAG: phospholipid scramblase 1 [Thelocarpon superellum]